MGYVTAELNSGRFFKQDAPLVSVKTVGISKESIKTMGGLSIIPDCVIDNIRYLCYADIYNERDTGFNIIEAKATNLREAQPYCSMEA